MFIWPAIWVDGGGRGQGKCINLIHPPPLLSLFWLLITPLVQIYFSPFWLSSFNFNSTQCLVAFLWRNSLQVTSWLHLNCINSVGSSSHKKTVEADHHSNRCFSTRHFASRHSSSILKRDACVFRLLICDKLYAMLPHAL